jgi:hypothetical protein
MAMGNEVNLPTANARALKIYDKYVPEGSNLSLELFENERNELFSAEKGAKLLSMDPKAVVPIFDELIQNRMTYLKNNIWMKFISSKLMVQWGAKIVTRLQKSAADKVGRRW